MTKKQKYSPNNRYSEQLSGEEAVELVNLDINTDDADITPVPIDNYLEDEEILDLILVGSDANTENEESDLREMEIDQTIDDIDLDLQEENVQQFSVEPVDEEDDEFIDQLMTAKRLDEDSPNFDIISPLENLTIDKEKEWVDLEPILQENNQDQKTENTANLLLIKQALLDDKDFVAALAKDNHSVKPYIPPVTQNNTTRRTNITLIILVLLVLGLSVKIFMLTKDVSKLQTLTSLLEEDVSLLQDKKPTNTPPVSQVSPEPVLPNNQQLAQAIKPVENAVSQVDTEKNQVLPLNNTDESKLGINNSTDQKKNPPTLSKQLSSNSTSKSNLENTSVKQLAQTPQKKNNPTVTWAVNIVAFKSEIEAKRKSSKLIAQGIPVKVSTFNTSNGVWYQLKVIGFKTRDNAESYASKLRKSTNLNSISAIVN